MSQVSGRPGRSAPEWWTFAVSCLVLAVVAALVLAQLLGDTSPAAPRAEVTSAVREVSGHHHVDVEVTNDGDETAANVVVGMEFVVDEETATAEQTIDFLAGDERVRLVFVLDHPPSAGVLTVAVSGYEDP